MPLTRDSALDDLQGLLDGSLVVEGLAIDTDLRWALVVGLAEVRAFRRRRDRRRSSSATTPSPARSAPPSALASRPTAEAKAEAWEHGDGPGDVPNETQRAIVLSFMQLGQEEILAPYVDKYLEAADDIWDSTAPSKASTALEYIFPKPMASPELLDELDAWLDTSRRTPAPSATSARAATTSRARCGRRPRTPRQRLSASRLELVTSPSGSACSYSACRVCGARAWAASIVDTALEAADEVAGGERRLHLEDGELDLVVGQGAA